MYQNPLYRYRYGNPSIEEIPTNPVEFYLWTIDHNSNDKKSMSDKESKAWRNVKVFLRIRPYDKKRYR